MQNIYDHIKEKSSNETKFLHNTLQIKMKFVVLSLLIKQSWQVWNNSKDYLLKKTQFTILKKTCLKCVCLYITLYKNEKNVLLIGKHS